ncbi:MAG: hypothetical protein KGI08_01985 [Thaumarchaeota archaeon]|nr:hypothetical protein [Nitrososphaerota archaeon]
MKKTQQRPGIKEVVFRSLLFKGFILTFLYGTIIEPFSFWVKIWFILGLFFLLLISLFVDLMIYRQWENAKEKGEKFEDQPPFIL